MQVFYSELQMPGQTHYLGPRPALTARKSGGWFSPGKNPACFSRPHRLRPWFRLFGSPGLRTRATSLHRHQPDIILVLPVQSAVHVTKSASRSTNELPIARRSQREIVRGRKRGRTFGRHAPMAASS